MYGSSREAQAEDTATYDNRLYITIGSTDDLPRVPITLHLENPTIDIMPVIEQKGTVQI